MKVLTIKQPWASLIVSGYKRYEFRSWKTKYRGEFLIHAGLGEDKEALTRLKSYLKEPLPKGKIIGKANLVNCVKCDEEFKNKALKENPDVYKKSSFSENYAFVLENVKALANPIDIKGKLSFWEYDFKE